MLTGVSDPSATAATPYRIDATWPAFAGASASSAKYHFLYRAVGDAVWRRVDTDTQLATTVDVSANTTYEYTLAVSSVAAGMSDWATVQTVAVPALPTVAPTDTASIVGSSFGRSLELRFTSFANNFPRGYKLYYRVGQ